MSIYVTSPSTVTIDWGTTGEKTLLQVTDNLSAGKKIAIFALGWDAASDVSAQGRFRIYAGTSMLVETGITERLNAGGMRAKHVMLFAYLESASANQQWSFKVNVTTAVSGSSTLHVQAMVILVGNAFYSSGINTSISAGSTVTITSVSTNFPSGSRVVVLAYVIMSVTSTTGGHRIYSAENIRILEGSTNVSSNQFQVGTYADTQPAHVSLAYFNGNTQSNPTYSVQVYNSLSETSQAWAQIVAFAVGDGAFLDTGSVSLTSDSQVTVGNLSTSLSGEVGVLALAAAENTGSTSAMAFNAEDVVLQIDNQSSDQVANQRAWSFERTTYHGRSGIYSLFRYDTNVSNPSYQVKMTARASGINGEAKIVAFTFTVFISVMDSGAGVEITSGLREVEDSGVGVDYATGGMEKPVDDYGYGVEDIHGLHESIDSGVGVEYADMTKSIEDSGYGVDAVISPVFKPVGDYVVGGEVSVIRLEVDDSGAGVDAFFSTRETLDSGAGVDEISFMSKEYRDSGTVVEIPTINVFMNVGDVGLGVDIVGLLSTVKIFDEGRFVDETDWFLSIYGYVLVDGSEYIGRHSIPYKDWSREGLPIQTHRRSVFDGIYVDNDNVGNMSVEWDDKVSDIMSGQRTITVLLSVVVVDW